MMISANRRTMGILSFSTGVHQGPPSITPGPTRLTPRHNSARSRVNVTVKTAEQPHDFDLCSSQQDTNSGQCPFLAGLRTPPAVNLPWFQRAQLQVANPGKFQATALGQRSDDTMVQIPEQPLLGSFYMPASMQLVQDVFAADSAGITTQGLGGKRIIFKGFSTLLGDSSLFTTVDPNRHKQLRTLLQPAFSADAIPIYLPDIQDLIQRHLESWEAAGDDGVKAHERLRMLTFEFIIQAVAGHVIPDDDIHQLSQLFKSFASGFLAWPYLDIPFTPWHRALKAQKELTQYFQSSVTAAREQLAAGDDVSGVMGKLVAAVDEDGNSTTLTRCMSNLQDHPAVVQGLREEQAVVLEQHGNNITAAALKDMVYADAVVRETMRLDPISSVIFRVATRDFALGGYAVPAGTVLTLPLRHLAEHDPRWENSTGDMDPSLFNPDRMLTPGGSKPGQLMPFGGGVRYCLGAGLAMAEKVFLALLERGFDFVADNNTDWKLAMGYYPANGLPLVLTRRNLP